ncbi:MAG: TetR family transcriptional regulator [Bacteroidia bacterium]|nr:TetR family transcriptional regulator [Bacteroidia bacterium]
MKELSKKEKFLKETLKLFYSKGFKATTMRDIAKKLNFEVANIYNYIDSKQALLEDALFDISYTFHHSIDNILESSYSPEEKLKLIISSHIKLTVEKPYEMALMVNEWRNLKPEKLKKIIERKKDYENKVAMVLQEGIEHGHFRKMNVVITTKSLLSSLRWLYDEYPGSQTRFNPIEIEKQIIDFIFAGISKN